MSDTEMTSRLEQRWVPVTDSRGRTRMEACWIQASEEGAAARPQATHAA